MALLFLGYTPDAIANYFLSLAKAKREPITPMKLQKLMYFAQGFHLALEKRNSPLIAESVEAWNYGPVFPSTYHEFKDFGDQVINREAASVEVEKNGALGIVYPTIDAEQSQRAKWNPAGVGDLPFAKAVMQRVWDVYGRYPATKLSELTHERGTPWWTVREKAKEIYGGRIPLGLNIPNQTIRDWFKTQFPTAASPLPRPTTGKS